MFNFVVFGLLHLSFFGSSCDAGNCDSRFQLSAEDIEPIYYPDWGYFFETNNGWIILPHSGKKRGIPIFHLSHEEGIQQLVEPDIRLGINYLDGASLGPDNTLYLADLFQTNLYQVDLAADIKRLKKMGTISQLMGVLHVFEGNLIGGSQSLEIITLPGQEKTWIDEINASLPDSRFHPVSKVSNLHQMKLAHIGDELFIGFSFSPVYFRFPRPKQSSTFQEIAISFKGYKPPEKKWSKKASGDPKRMREEVGKFHQLLRFSVRDHHLYGLFQRGFEEEMFWVRLFPKGPNTLLYANHEQEEKIFALGEKSILMGHYHEPDDGDRVVCLRITNQISKI